MELCDELFQANRQIREETLEDVSHESSETVGDMWKAYQELCVQQNEQREHLFMKHLGLAGSTKSGTYP